MSTHDGYCYMWNESVAERGSAEVATTFYNFLQNLPVEIKEVVGYSDTCGGGQNCNRNVSAMFLFVVQNI